MKKLLILLVSILICNPSAFSQTVYDDNYQENPNYIQGTKYLENSQYSSAITEFKKAIRVNPLDNSSLIGLSNSYNMRAAYYNNTMNAPDNAISDLKSALFFIKYFAANNTDFSMAQSISAMEKNLSILESSLKEKIDDAKRFNSARTYRTKGEFAAAGYDYFQLLNNDKYAFQSNIAIGDIFKIFNRPDRSVFYFQKAISINPDNTDTHLKLARTYEQLNDFSSSLKEYNYALNTSSEREDILNSLERIWQKKVDSAPNDAEAHANLGVVYQKQKRFQEAMMEYKKAENLNPANINTKINIGTLLQEQNKYNEAINVYNSILQLQPQNIQVMTYRAECLKNLKRNDEAIAMYKTILNIDNKNATAKAELYDLLKATMPPEAVLDFLYKNVQNSPMNADSYYEFAYELHKANKIDDAIVYYLQTIKLDNKKIDAYINLSQAYRQKKDYNESFEIIKKAIAIEPENELVKKQYDIAIKEFDNNKYNLASEAFQAGDYQRAISEYMKINPPTADSLTGIAISYQHLNNNNQAILYYKKAMEIDSKNSDLPYYIASIYTNQNDFNNAKIYADLSLEKNPANSKSKELADYINAKQSETMLSESVQLYDNKKYNEAIEILNKVINTNSSNATAYYYRAMAFDALNDFQKAIADYKSTIKYAPEMAIAYYSLAVDYDAVTNYQSAKENYQKYIELSGDDNDYTKYAQSRINEIK